VEHLDRVRRRRATPPASEDAAKTARAGDGDRDRKRLEAEARNARYAREKPLRQELQTLEARIAVLEAEDKTAQAALADPDLYQDYARAKPHMDTHQRATRELERLYARWEELQQSLGSP